MNKYEEEVWLDVEHNPKFEINMLVAINWSSGTYVGKVVRQCWSDYSLTHKYDVECRGKNGYGVTVRYGVYQQDMERYCPSVFHQRKLLQYWSKVCK